MIHSSREPLLRSKMGVPTRHFPLEISFLEVRCPSVQQLLNLDQQNLALRVLRGWDSGDLSENALKTRWKIIRGRQANSE